MKNHKQKHVFSVVSDTFVALLGGVSTFAQTDVFLTLFGVNLETRFGRRKNVQRDFWETFWRLFQSLIQMRSWGLVGIFSRLKGDVSNPKDLVPGDIATLGGSIVRLLHQ